MILLKLLIIVKKIKSKECRKHGEKFSLESIAPKYEKFFSDVANVHEDKGWYAIGDKSMYTKEWLAKQK